VAGVAGEYIVMARRHGDTWYVGGMTDWTSRELTVPLHFLAPGQYKARLYVDGSLNEDEPNAIQMEEKTVEADTSLPIRMASGGGSAVIIAPK
jgi:alpha-glucosidase